MACSATRPDTRLSEARNSELIELAKYKVMLTRPKAIQRTMMSTEAHWAPPLSGGGDPGSRLGLWLLALGALILIAFGWCETERQVGRSFPAAVGSERPDDPPRVEYGRGPP